jgi:hypothetical protein
MSNERPSPRRCSLNLPGVMRGDPNELADQGLGRENELGGNSNLARAVNVSERLNLYAWLMSWFRKLDEPIALKDGRTLATLADANRLMDSLPEPRLRTDHWQSTHDLLVKAACRDGRFALAQVRAQLPRALKADGLI